MIQVVGLFLIAMVVLAVYGRVKRGLGKTPRSAKRCPSCGRHRIGSGPCACGRG